MKRGLATSGGEGTQVNKYLSFGGGVDSTALMLLLLDDCVNFEAIFVNHGGDMPETYEYVDYLRAEGYEITEIKPDVSWKGHFSDIYDYFFFHKSIPLVGFRICTDKFKIRPFNKYVKKPCVVYIGFDALEKKRVRKRPVKGITYEYPLIENGLTRSDCKNLIRKHVLKIPIRSGCYFCPFQTKKEWKKLMVTHPDLFKKAVALENNSPKVGLFADGKMRLESLWQENKLDQYLTTNRG